MDFINIYENNLVVFYSINSTARCTAVSDFYRFTTCTDDAKETERNSRFLEFIVLFTYKK